MTSRCRLPPQSKNCRQRRANSPTHPGTGLPSKSQRRPKYRVNPGRGRKGMQPIL